MLGHRKALEQHSGSEKAQSEAEAQAWEQDSWSWLGVPHICDKDMGHVVPKLLDTQVLLKVVEELRMESGPEC